MRSKAIGWAVLLSLILLAANVALAQSPKPSYAYVYAGMDDIGGYWELKDENLINLEDGDTCLIMWAGPDGAIDPPVLSMGSPSNGLPTGDDVVIRGGAVAWANVFLTVATFLPGETDSLGNQHRPIPGDRIYLRIFNNSDLTSTTFYGDSDLYEVTGSIGESFFTQMPNDPDGPTTASQIFGRFFKVIGGIDPNTGHTFPIRDPHDNLEDGDLVQLIWVGPDGEIDLPDLCTLEPGDDDVLVDTWGVNEGMYPSINTAVFRRFTSIYDHESHGRPAQGDVVYVRLFNANNILEAYCWGNSSPYSIQYVVGESLSVFYDDSVDCDLCYPPPPRDLTIWGGLNPNDMSPWPMVDADGIRLQDGDLVQLIWAGLDSLVAEMDTITGSPTGDDSLLTTWGIGEGMGGVGTGRFKLELYTYETHKKGGYPAQGDIIYLRVFNDPTCAGATHYGESETYLVIHEMGEEFFTFPDSAADADTPNPCYTSVEWWTDPSASVPTRYALHQNYPNPFNPDTEIEYAIPSDVSVTLKVYNVYGAEVATLVDFQQRTGVYTVRWYAGDLASGVYFCRLQAGEFGKTVKMVLLR